MNWWRRTRKPEPETSGNLTPPIPELAPSDGMLPLLRLASAARSEASGSLTDPLFISREVRLNMEVDDAAVAQLRVTEQNAAAMVEATQRLRDYHERERSSVRPVYNFGGESFWSGGEG